LRIIAIGAFQAPGMKNAEQPRALGTVEAGDLQAAMS
jgi:hypothetical protein